MLAWCLHRACMVRRPCLHCRRTMQASFRSHASIFRTRVMPHRRGRFIRLFQNSRKWSKEYRKCHCGPRPDSDGPGEDDGSSCPLGQVSINGGSVCFATGLSPRLHTQAGDRKKKRAAGCRRCLPPSGRGTGLGSLQPVVHSQRSVTSRRALPGGCRRRHRQPYPAGCGR